MRIYWLLILTLCGAVVQAQKITLPIIDDFSMNDLSWNEKIWDKNQSSSHLNRNRAVHPPSVGVMSFDGIDNSGQYYTTTPKDKLVSKKLDLSDYSGNSVWLSFFLEFGGYGNISKSVTSAFELSMVDKQGEKKQLRSWAESEFTSQDSFLFFAVEVSSEFVHANSQIYFEMISDQPQDYNDSWHLDYVSIDEAMPPGFSFDISFSNEPTSLLSKYSSMPFAQFYVRPGAMLADTFSLDFYNHFPYKEKLLEDKLTIQSKAENGPEFTAPFLQKVPDVATNQNFLATGNTLYQNPTPKTRLEEYFLDFSPQKNQKFDLTYTFIQDEEILFGAETFLRNNKINQILEFGDRYKLDDGSYEESYFIQQRSEATSPGIAVEFETFLNDKLKGFDILLINTLKQEEFVFDFSVYLDTLDSDPIFTVEDLRYTPVYDEVNQVFLPVTYLFSDHSQTDLNIPHGKFYLAFSIKNENKGKILAFGFDRSSYHGFPNLYFRGSVNNKWRLQEGKKFEGYSMIHPIMANNTDITTSVSSKENQSLNISIYPNPSQGFITIDNQESQVSYYSIFDNLGKMIQPLTNIKREKLTLSLSHSGVNTIVFYNSQMEPVAIKQLMNQ